MAVAVSASSEYLDLTRSYLVPEQIPIQLINPRGAGTGQGTCIAARGKSFGLKCGEGKQRRDGQLRAASSAMLWAGKREGVGTWLDAELSQRLEGCKVVYLSLHSNEIPMLPKLSNPKVFFQLCGARQRLKMFDQAHTAGRHRESPHARSLPLQPSS
eukprot:6204760-Pleurochrysis_carterae.AAC.3